MRRHTDLQRRRWTIRLVTTEAACKSLPAGPHRTPQEIPDTPDCRVPSHPVTFAASEGTPRTRRRTMTSTRKLQITAVVAACASLLAPLQAQRGARLPFAPGEACTYRGSGPLGRMGSGTFSIARDSASDSNWVLRFDFRGRMGI